MPARDHKENLLLYYYGELTSEEATEFERHLAGCPQCRQELELLKSLSSELRSEIENPPDYALENIRTRILKPVTLSLFKRVYKPALAFASIAILVLAFHMSGTIKTNSETLPWNDYFNDRITSIDSELDVLASAINDI